jgi:hypothetical protein
METCFHIQDNILDKNLTAKLEQMSFSQCYQVKNVGQDIKKFYAKYFTKKDEKRAKEELSYQSLELRKKDVVLISFFSGCISVALFFLIVFLAIPDSAVLKGPDFPLYNESSFNQLFSSIYTFRLLFIMIFIIAACGVALKVLR